MTKQELLNYLKGFDDSDDYEYAVEILLAYVNDEDIKKAFEKIPKWYD
jgi:hypothetical protein